MRDLATVEKITAIRKIEGKDKIEYATIANWNVIIEKGVFKVGDLVVYIEYDTILPEVPEFEFLRSRCWSKLYKGFRIRNMKMAGVFSQGIVFSVSILKEPTKVKEGQNVAEELGIIRYAPEELIGVNKNNDGGRSKKWYMKYKFFRKLFLPVYKQIEYPFTVTKSDETNVQKNIVSLRKYPGKFYTSEKLEGQSATFLMVQKEIKRFIFSNKITRDYLIFSHRAYRDNKTPSNWKTISDQFDMEGILRPLDRNLAIQGEIIGKGIQSNIYELEGLDFYVFKITNTDTGEIFSFQEMKDFCLEHNLKAVPIIDQEKQMLSSADAMLEYAEGKSVLLPRVKREGLVWRSLIDPTIGCKAKSVSYAIWFGKKHDKTL